VLGHQQVKAGTLCRVPSTGRGLITPRTAGNIAPSQTRSQYHGNRQWRNLRDNPEESTEPSHPWRSPPATRPDMPTVHDHRYIDLVAHLDISAHHRRMIETAWTLGGDPRYERLNLRRWAHMLGFPGHFLTKSRAYSTTFGAIRHERRTWRLVQDLAELDAATDDPNDIPADPTTVTVINDWTPVRFGHRDHAERELALAIAERNRQHRRSTITTRRAA
jgi:hypothetical protein